MLCTWSALQRLNCENPAAAAWRAVQPCICNHMRVLLTLHNSVGVTGYCAASSVRQGGRAHRSSQVQR